MPKSKKPRKKGRFGRKAKATSFFMRHADDLDAVSDRIIQAQHDFATYAHGADRIKFLCGYTSERLRSSHIADFFALDRLPTTCHSVDIKRVSSTITIGILLTDLIELETDVHKELNKTLQFGLYMSIMALRMRAYEKTVPEANLNPIHEALDIAHQLIGFAFDHDRAKLMTARRANAEAVDGEAAIRRDRRALGKHWATVREWAQIDLDYFSKHHPDLMPPINTIHAPASWAKDFS